jgi:hypothetical protein
MITALTPTTTAATTSTEELAEEITSSPPASIAPRADEDSISAAPFSDILVEMGLYPVDAENTDGVTLDQP